MLHIVSGCRLHRAQTNIPLVCDSAGISMDNPVLQAIRKRRSIREYTDQPVPRDLLLEIIQAGIWSPSGLNNQPWRFVIVTDDDVRKELSLLTHYTHIIAAAPSLIAVFLEKEAMYDSVKDHQAAGACIQNMLLAVEAMGLGAVWLGQILKNKDKVNALFGLSDGFDLMAVLAVGYPAHRNQKSTRKELDSFILKVF